MCRLPGFQAARNVQKYYTWPKKCYRFWAELFRKSKENGEITNFEQRFVKWGLGGARPWKDVVYYFWWLALLVEMLYF